MDDPLSKGSWESNASFKLRKFAELLSLVEEKGLSSVKLSQSEVFPDYDNFLWRLSQYHEVIDKSYRFLNGNASFRVYSCGVDSKCMFRVEVHARRGGKWNLTGSSEHSCGPTKHTTKNRELGSDTLSVNKTNKCNYPRRFFEPIACQLVAKNTNMCIKEVSN